jgi:hypothetical protein
MQQLTIQTAPGAYKLSIKAYGFNWGFGSGKSHCGVAKSIIKKNVT